jgi:protein-S-isoprenylcysteine O-methyltransferase Ste14
MSDSTDTTSFDFSDKEKLQMLENWFQKRAEMSSRALKLILIPVIAVLVFALVFWFQYYIPVPAVVLLGILGGSVLAWIVCLFMGGGVLKKVRTGDAIMLRKIRSSDDSVKS